MTQTPGPWNPPLFHPVGLPIREDNSLKLGQLVIGDALIVMHPLDVNALRFPNPYDRLRALDRWVADELHRRIGGT